MRGRVYSDRPITGVWLGPTNGVRLREVSAYERCPLTRGERGVRLRGK